jgi:hypothetical protein
MALRSLIVVRPYREGIRKRVFALLAAAGVDVDNAVIIQKDSSDSTVIQTLRGTRPGVLLIPFHARLDESGNEVNGLDLCERLEQSLPELSQVPIVMPASAAAVPALRLRMSWMSQRPVSDAVKKRLIVLEEELLDDEATKAALVSHLSAFPS